MYSAPQHCVLRTVYHLQPTRRITCWRWVKHFLVEQQGGLDNSLAVHAFYSTIHYEFSFRMCNVSDCRESSGATSEDLQLHIEPMQFNLGRARMRWFIIDARNNLSILYNRGPYCQHGMNLRVVYGVLRSAEVQYPVSMQPTTPVQSPSCMYPVIFRTSAFNGI